MVDQTGHSASEPAVIAWISIGSNLAQPVQQVQKAIQALGELPDSKLLWRSHLYRTEPVGGVEQPAFINAVARLQTHLPAQDLMQALQNLEALAGRQRSAEIFWGPRILDLDLLSYGYLISRDPSLRIPHPRMSERAFVLIPLAEFDPALKLPGCGCIADYLPAVADQSVTRLPESAIPKETLRPHRASA
ncbi:2-amino-4-hydroxy-6-hydroxymethyldihydropteridine diphosphokinase [Acidithiobacillus thiooxidans]|jgi:2-amino-4-hydroxy-6-hydroxymethyldihydropteridine diphosphokinase|uniref:2-amino-4-hydroxy-6- hydroxymethyldihydropteridine diphosphokinase n=1 Tax=Acidithiobacillus thiooxidans TaxID=930 RepID=UPI001C06A897|nr:2-amino-4-hydroxy-6-hydroxymethyldihydropteridine diphosphokinase [Acidithiobacillus thiooxidans]MBU2843810.1 2-amino-4-hydroxy-6-hydroxymethyldihydropteridine diphosphokinase [Acidithiobacillus thiooxidans]